MLILALICGCGATKHPKKSSGDDDAGKSHGSSLQNDDMSSADGGVPDEESGVDSLCDAGARDVSHPEDVEDFKSLKNNPRPARGPSKCGGVSTTTFWRLREDIERLKEIEEEEKVSSKKLQGTENPAASHPNDGL